MKRSGDGDCHVADVEELPDMSTMKARFADAAWDAPDDEARFC
jgi:hypothetical protein